MSTHELFDTSDVLDDPSVKGVLSSIRPHNDEDDNMIDNDIPIEDDVPVPTTSHRQRKFPLDQMAPGQSFLVQAEDGEALKKLRASLSSAIRNYRRTMARKGYDVDFTTRTEGMAIRCWRIDNLDGE